MDSPELQYLKAMQKVNQRFYAHTTLELANTQARIAALTEMMKDYVITERGYDADRFRDDYLEKLKELSTGFQTAAEATLDLLNQYEDLDSDGDR